MRRVLALSFFPAFFPPSSGGELRLYHFYLHLSSWANITLLSSTYSDAEEEWVQHSPTFKELRIPRSKHADHLHQLLDQSEIGTECSALSIALSATETNAYQRRLRYFLQTADLVIHESPFTFPFDDFNDSPTVPRIYNSYNVESDLAEQMYGGPLRARAVGFVERIERELLSKASRVFATSTEEAARFTAKYLVAESKIDVVPNGFAPNAFRDSSNQFREGPVLFIGSAHPPNIQAARLILHEIAPVFPKTRFVIAGDVCRFLGDVGAPSNVQLLGRINEENKQRLLRECVVALNPMLTGAGTNLKMLDFMANGCPIVTTTVGARGMGIKSGMQALVGSRDEMPQLLGAALADSDLRARLGAHAKKHANEQFRWDHIVRRVAPIVLTTCSGGATRARARCRVLVLNDYPISDASAGGQRRMLELYGQLGINVDATLLALDNVASVQETWLRAGLRQVRVPKSKDHLIDEVHSASLGAISASDVLAGRHCLRNPLFVERVREEALRADVVVFEHCYLAPLISVLPASKPVVYSSQNVESTLKPQVLALRPDAEHLLNDVFRFERELIERADLVICVSPEDSAWISSRYPEKNVEVIENGVSLASLPSGSYEAPILRDEHTPFRAIFVGSAHPPNIEAARYIASVLARSLPYLHVDLVGDVCGALDRSSLPENVHLHGRLEESAKVGLLRAAYIGLNPMISGGGSSLKIPEMMAFGLPIVSTTVGVRGYGLLPDVHYFEAEIATFAEAVKRILSEPHMARRVGEAAKRFTLARLPWFELAKKMSRLLTEQKGRARTHRRVLAITTRLAFPPRGGAEVFLDRVLTRIQARGHLGVTAVGFCSGEIENQFHFSGKYRPPAEDLYEPSFEIVRFNVEEPPVEMRLRQARALSTLWAGESVDRCRLLSSDGADSVLLGGWHFPEVGSDTTVARWTSKRAEIRIQPDCEQVTVIADAPFERRLTAELDGASLERVSVKGPFKVVLNVGKSAEPRILSLVVDETSFADGDPRPLGVRVSKLVVHTASLKLIVDLRRDLGEVARTHDPQSFIDAMIDTVERREPGFDMQFANLRGPWSAAFDEWIDQNVARFDVVLAHAAPFRTIVAAQIACARRGVPCVALPHMHADDPYYHWQEFYRAYRGADCVIAAPESAKPWFFDRIGARSISCAGGGVDPDEFGEDSLRRAKEAWARVRPTNHPFVLVLGRKAGGKHYDVIIEGVSRVRRLGRSIDVVLIGPDEDGVPVDPNLAHVLGMQPRDVALGALTESLALANMSESESFGIVLLEAWLAGSTVIASSACAAFRELVIDGENGFLCANSGDIEARLLQLLDSPDLRKMQALRGAHLEGSYTWDALSAQIESVLLQVADGTLKTEVR